MSANDLFGGELPSDSESDDSDYVSQGEGSSVSDADDRMEDGSKHEKKSFKKEIQRVKVAKIFEALQRNEESKLRAENHSDVLIDPVMLAFQQRQPPKPKSTNPMEDIQKEMAKYSNSTKTDEPVDVAKYKRLARGSLIGQSVNSQSVTEALSGLSNAHVQVEEEVRFAGQVVKLNKMVERTSSHAARFERRKRALEDQSTLGGGGLASFQSYLNQIKSHRAVTSVEKSVTDWNQLKLSTDGMEQALQVDRGYLEKQAFLARSGVREEEIRRETRRKKMLESNPDSAI